MKDEMDVGFFAFLVLGVLLILVGIAGNSFLQDPALVQISMLAFVVGVLFVSGIGGIWAITVFVRWFVDFQNRRGKKE